MGLSQALVASNGVTTTHNLFGLDLIHQDDGTTTRTLLADGLDSVRTEMAGSAVETVTTYEPYGNLLAQTGTSGTTYGFTGEQHDAATGLLYLRARYYNPYLNQFQSRDPFSGYATIPASQNGYSYAHNNPANLIDPTGRYADQHGFIEQYAQRVHAWSLWEGPNRWLNTVTRALPFVNRVYNSMAVRLTAHEFSGGTVTQLYAATWLESLKSIQQEPCINDPNPFLEAAHVSMITLAAYSRNVGPRGIDGISSFFPGYIPNPREARLEEQRGADTARHFLFHAFLSFEMRYSMEYAPITADQLSLGLMQSGASNQRIMEKIQAIRDEYRSSGYQDFDYLTQEDYYAYQFAATAGDLYEVISTYDSVESYNPGGFCYDKGGIPYRLRGTHGCAIYAFTDSLNSFQALMSNPSDYYPSGVQDPGVFSRDLLANRSGADFGIRAFHSPTALP